MELELRNWNWKEFESAFSKVWRPRIGACPANSSAFSKVCWPRIGACPTKFFCVFQGLTTKDRCVSRYTWQSYKWTNDICVFLDLNQRRRCLSRISKSCIDRSILVTGSHMKLAPAMVDTVAFLVQIWGDMEYLLDLPHMIASLFLLVSGKWFTIIWRLSEEVPYSPPILEYG
jgi:hypothetical protein